jgi:1-deoxy-D-xylulose-5-phosphate synthase
VVVVEDGIRTGGVGAATSQLLRDAGIEVPVRNIGVPPRFLDHGKRGEVLVECGLTAQDISRSIVETMAHRTDADPDGTSQDADSQEPSTQVSP